MRTAEWVNRGLPLLLVAMIGVVVWLNAGRQEAPAQAVVCTDLSKGCAARIAGREVRFGTDTAIKPLKAFEVWVQAPGAQQIEARFTMEGMDMGFNLYTLRTDDQGVHKARITLPVCVSGRRDWVMTLDIDGTDLAVPFVTDL